MKLSIIILSYNTKDLVLKCIRLILEHYGKEVKNKEFEIIVVDNASEDSSVQFLEKIRGIKLIKNRENYGFSKGCNIGAKKAQGEYVLFFNSDARIEDQGLTKMIYFLQRNSKVGVLGGKLINFDGSQQASCGNFYSLINLPLIFSEWIGFRKKPAKIQNVDWVSGGSMMIRRELFEELKGFDEKLFMYMEDMELCFRVKKRGFQTFFFPDIKIVHRELGSSNRSFAVNQIYKGILYFFRKHKPYWQYLIIKFLLIAKAIIAVLLGSLSNNSYLKRTYKGALKFAV